MEIDINQQKISLGDKYQIFIDGQQRHNAAYKSEGNKKVINIDIGRIGPQTKKFDPNWQPKY